MINWLIATSSSYVYTRQGFIFGNSYLSKYNRTYWSQVENLSRPRTGQGQACQRNADFYFDKLGSSQICQVTLYVCKWAPVKVRLWSTTSRSWWSLNVKFLQSTRIKCDTSQWKELVFSNGSISNIKAQLKHHAKSIPASMCPLVHVQEMSLVTEGAVARDELILEPQPTPCQLPV